MRSDPGNPFKGSAKTDKRRRTLNPFWDECITLIIDPADTSGNKYYSSTFPLSLCKSKRTFILTFSKNII